MKSKVVTVEVGGASYSAIYTTDAGAITVHWDGTSQSTIMHVSEELEAKRLLRELVLARSE